MPEQTQSLRDFSLDVTHERPASGLWRPQLRPISASGRRENLTPAATLLLLLVCTDLAFILLHLVNVETRWMRGIPISLEADGGLPETYQYVKEFWIAVGMAALFWRTRIRAFAVWAGVFAFLLFDDAGQVHERVGTWLGQQYALPSIFGLRPDDTGELLVAGLVGATTVTLVGLSWWRGSEQSRRVSRDLLCLVFLLAVLGVAVDMMHVLSYLHRSLLAQVLLVIEDGGEMLVMSALTAYTFHVLSHGGRTRLDLWANVKARTVGPALPENAGRAS